MDLSEEKTAARDGSSRRPGSSRASGRAPQAGRLNERTPRIFRRIVLFICAALLIAPLLAWVLFVAAVRLWTYPTAVEARSPAATIIQGRNGTPLAMFAAADGQWRMPLQQVQINP